MVVPASADLNTDSTVFEFSTPEYRLSARGVKQAVDPSSWDGAGVAEAVESLLVHAGNDGPVVGCIPFDTGRPAVLYVPEEVSWRQGSALVDAPVGTAAETAAEAPQHAVGDELRVPDSPSYRRAVARAVDRIGAGELEKVVLARTMSLEADGGFDVDRIAADLGTANPHAYIYRADLTAAEPAGRDGGLRGEAHPILVGASPELVLRSRRGAVTSAPLAGSIPRDRGNPARDRELTRGLLASPKDRAEHGLVVRQVGDVFRDHADNVVVPETPSVISTPVILHLGSRITGRLPGTGSPGAVMRMLYDLHPTPAVCGWPTASARGVIDELEDFDRGMYSGLVGWVDADGNAEWALTLRGGVVTGSRAQLFAGAGIVEGSVPEDEHRETATKFATFARVLQDQQRRSVSV
ncbi:isochorismate synthase [Corynebacterium sp. USCH3]|uniref:isochorismate synthase n=1 Tax=Corynebacterium sp. USCH3 TaxID=3024840 RepID=UPI00309C3C46